HLPAQIATASVADSGRVIHVTLLNHSPPIINIPGLRYFTPSAIASIRIGLCATVSRVLTGRFVPSAATAAQRTGEHIFPPFAQTHHPIIVEESARVTTGRTVQPILVMVILNQLILIIVSVNVVVVIGG